MCLGVPYLDGRPTDSPYLSSRYNAARIVPGFGRLLRQRTSFVQVRENVQHR